MSELQSPSPVAPSTQEPRQSKFGAYLFWSWNLIVLAFVLLGFAPTLLPELIRSIDLKVIPPFYLTLLAGVIAVPIASIILGLTVLRRSPARLLALGYVVEGPLMLLLLFRFFAIRQGNPSVNLILVVAFLGMAAFLWVLFSEPSPRHPFWAYLRLAGLAMMVLLVIYAAVMVAFYVPPLVVFLGTLIGEFAKGLLELFRNLPASIPNFGFLPFVILGPVLLLYTATLVVGLPVATPVLTIRALLKDFRTLSGAGQKNQAMAAMLLPLIVVIGLLAASLRQPQQQAFALLDQPPASVEQAQKLLGQSQEIRAGLLNAYLAPFRYISATGEVSHVRYMYEQAFHLFQDTALPIQRVYEFMASPLLYQPYFKPENPYQDNVAFQVEPVKAEQLYKQFFDQSIVDGERPQIEDAVRSTYDGLQAEAAWQTIDDREIHLNRQELKVAEHGDWAEIELYEVYQNRTTQRQEVVYYFSLPESAVITGVWLGNSADRSQRFAYQVAPRGAAQSVYTNEVLQRVDPALVEQIGPRQYRLRAFPVEPMFLWGDNLNRKTVAGPELHLWLTYNIFSESGAWRLPQLAEKQNVFWDSTSVRLVDGQPLPASTMEWLPVSVPVRTPSPAIARKISFPGGENVVVSPVDASYPRLPAGKNIAVVLDRSRSMANFSAELRAELTSLQQAMGPDLDVYLTSSNFRGEDPALVSLKQVDPDRIVFFGGQDAAALIAQFETLAGDRKYDAVLVLTDDTGFGLYGLGIEVAVPSAPLWIVHLGGFYPAGYDDPTLEAVQASGGGVAGSVEEALQRLAVRQQSGGDVIDGYYWHAYRPGEAVNVKVDASPEDKGLQALAARRLVLDEMDRSRDTLNQLEVLDRIHAVAVQNSIITPYSSMIVLVADRQKAQLERFEGYTDRFNREAEQVGTTQIPGILAVTGVPEPHEWLLIFIAVLLLLYVLRTKKFAINRS